MLVARNFFQKRTEITSFQENLMLRHAFEDKLAVSPISEDIMPKHLPKKD